MTKAKPDTPRNPVLECFGEAPLIEQDSKALNAGLTKLRSLLGEAVNSIEEIRRGNVHDILTGRHVAVGAMLEPGAALEAAQRWKSTLDAALEAAEQAHKLARQRERDATIAERRKTVEGTIARHAQAAANVDQCVLRLSAAIQEWDGAGLAVLRKAGVKLSGSLAQQFMHEHTRHLINLALHHRTEGLWAYDRIPLTRGYVSLAQESAALCGDVLSEFEARIEQQVERQEAAASEQAA
jgi:hypothetical protein